MARRHSKRHYSSEIEVVTPIGRVAAILRIIPGDEWHYNPTATEPPAETEIEIESCSLNGVEIDPYRVRCWAPTLLENNHDDIRNWRYLADYIVSEADISRPDREYD